MIRMMDCRRRLVDYFKILSQHHLQGMRKNTKNYYQSSPCPNEE
jgi:hypothetical protein